MTYWEVSEFRALSEQLLSQISCFSSFPQIYIYIYIYIYIQGYS